MKILPQIGWITGTQIFHEVILKLQIFCAHISWTSIVLRVLSSANHFWYIVSHVCVVTIVKPIYYGYTIWAAKFGKFCKLNTVDTKNWCPWNFRGFLMNWIYLSETLLGPIGYFFDGQKSQKRAKGFCFEVNFAHFCLPVFCVTLFLENHSIFSHKILCSCSWYNISGQYIQTMPLVCWGPIWGILEAYFGICTYFSWYLSNILSWNFVQVFLE